MYLVDSQMPVTDCHRASRQLKAGATGLDAYCECGPASGARRTPCVPLPPAVIWSLVDE